MPSAQDYLTVGYLYRSIRAAIGDLAARLGEAALFVGDPALQVGPEVVALTGLSRITDLASALAALDTIVEQGEGSPADTEASHYRRFIALREAFDARLAAEPDFAPSRAVVPNPVMRRPPDPVGKTYIDHPITAPVMDLANAIYAGMLRSLVQGFAETDAARKRLCIDAAIASMFGLVPVAEYLTTLPACAAEDGRRAGGGAATGEPDPASRGRPACPARRNPSVGRGNRLSRDAVPMRRLAEQALLRLLPQGSGLCRHGRAGDGRYHGARGARRRVACAATEERPPGGFRRHRGSERHRTDHPQGGIGPALPLWAIG